MKKAVLSSIKPGEVFKWGGVELVALEQTGDACICITKDFATDGCIAFESKSRHQRNNFRGSDILDWLIEWLDGILERDDVEKDDALTFRIDLMSVDGMNDYGFMTTPVGLLTLDEYRKYRAFIPPVGDWSWLATPWSCRASYEGTAAFVNAGGSVYDDYVYYARCGARPALHLKSSIFVSIQGEDEEELTSEQKEMALYEQVIEKFGERAQVIVAIEEMSELIKALTKWLRHLEFGQGDEETVLQCVAEERADVSIMLSQLDVIFGDNSGMECAKLDHLEELVSDV